MVLLLCSSVALLLCGSVALLICGSVDLWLCAPAKTGRVLSNSIIELTVQVSFPFSRQPVATQLMSSAAPTAGPHSPLLVLGAEEAVEDLCE